MKNTGFDEARSTYSAAEPAALEGTFRRFGPDGPAYEVMKLTSATHAAIRVISSGEELDYSLERLRRDPIAETIP